VSKSKTFTAGKKLILSVPDKVDFTSTDETVTLSWKSIPSVRGYAVYKVDADGKHSLCKRVRGNSAKISGLKQGKAYTFAVRTYVLEDKQIVYSDSFTTVRSATKPPLPKEFTAKAAQTSKAQAEIDAALASLKAAREALVKVSTEPEGTPGKWFILPLCALAVIGVVVAIVVVYVKKRK
jgi:hypothetical protein